MHEYTSTLTLSAEEAKELWLALGTRVFVLESQGNSVGRLRSLQGRVNNVWAAIEHAEKVRSGYTGEEIPRADAMERLAAGSDFIPYA